MRSLFVVRPVIFAVVAIVVSASLVGTAPDYRPLGAFFRYALEVFVLVVVILGASAVWWATRRGGVWDADLIPALAGAVGTFTLLGLLHGTPWGPNGLDGDQSFRTEFVTRFAAAPATADYTYAGLPAFYAPAYFWVLGQASALIGAEPWRLVKYGAAVTATLVPLTTYLLWRGILADRRVAAVISLVPFVVALFHAPYVWLVLFAIVPWWILLLRGAHGVSTRTNPIVLGGIGAILFLTYYYYFFLIGVAIAVYLGGLVVTRSPVAPALRYIGLVLAVSAGLSVVFWLPLIVSIVTVPGSSSLVNQYFGPFDGLPDVPFMASTPFALLSLLGLLYLVVRRRSLTSRAMLYLLIAVAVWWVLGFVAAIAGFPIVSVRSQPLISIILLSAGVIATFDVGRFAARRASRKTRSTVQIAGLVLGAAFALVAARTYVATLADSDFIARAHTTPLPDGRLPPTAPEGSTPEKVSANAIRDTIHARFSGPRQPVVLSTRVDVLALNPYYGFNQWHVYYAHPASRFRQRVAFLRELAGLTDPAQFAALSARNAFDGIDVFVLADDGETLSLDYREENFPDASRLAVIAFPRRLFEPNAFDLTDLGPYVVAVRR